MLAAPLRHRGERHRHARLLLAPAANLRRPRTPAPQAPSRASPRLRSGRHPSTRSRRGSPRPPPDRRGERRQLASSLDYETTLANVAALVVPTLADWCVVDIVGEDGAIQRLAVAHEDPAKVEQAQSLIAKLPVDPDSPRGAPAVIRTQQPRARPEISTTRCEERFARPARRCSPSYAASASAAR